MGDKTIELDYVLTWVLLAIANSPLRDRLAFKGGTALKKIYESDYRFSEDLGFTLLDDTSNEDLQVETEALFHWLRREVNLVLADLEAVSFQLIGEMGHKGLDPATLEDVLLRKQDTLSRLWEPRLRGQMPDLPHLDSVIRETNRWLRQSGLV